MHRSGLILLLSFSLLQIQAQDINPTLTPVALVALKFVRQGETTHVSVTHSTRIQTSKNRVESSSKEWTTDDFVCLLMDQDEHILDTLVIKHPLKLAYEYPNEDRTLGMINVDVTENEVLLRFPYDDAARFLLVSEVTNQRQLKTITRLTLKLHE